MDHDLDIPGPDATGGELELMIHGTIEVSGATEDDIELAIEAALDSIRRGNTSGFDRNETGSYRFELTEGAVDEANAEVNWTRLSADHWESDERDPDGAPLVRAMRQNENSPWRVSVSGHPELHGPYPSFTHVRHAAPTLLAHVVPSRTGTTGAIPRAWFDITGQWGARAHLQLLAAVDAAGVDHGDLEAVRRIWREQLGS